MGLRSGILMLFFTPNIVESKKGRLALELEISIRKVNCTYATGDNAGSGAVETLFVKCVHNYMRNIKIKRLGCVIRGGTNPVSN